MVETKLPKYILEKAIKSNNEFGWRENDVVEVINTAVENGLAILGGQVQFVFEDGTCELYWLNYNSNDKLNNENWSEYSRRTANECVQKLGKIASRNIESEAIEFFDFLKNKKNNGKEIYQNMIFILYFAEK